MGLEPVILEGPRIRLEPMQRDHLDALCDVGLDPELWKTTTIRVSSREDMSAYLAHATALQNEGTGLAFVIIDKALQRVVGSTRYANFDSSHRRLEIGWTWVGRRWQRTHVNTDTKYLLLRHAFEQLACQRVEFKTDALNLRSRRALLRIGATEEGILRKHMIVAGGRLRDSVYFSILDTEWPEVRQRLETMMQAR